MHDNIALSPQKSTLDWYRQTDGVTVVWRNYNLDSYVESGIPQSFIDLMTQDMETLRQARFTTIIRMLYTNVYVSKKKICREKCFNLLKYALREK